MTTDFPGRLASYYSHKNRKMCWITYRKEQFFDQISLKLADRMWKMYQR